MNKKKLQQYAELLVKQGIRVQKGEEVWLSASVQNHEFAELIAEECYKAKARHVKIEWFNDKTAVLNYKFMKLKDLGTIPSYEMAKFKYQCKKLPSRLYISDEDPDAFAEVDPEKMAKARMMSYPKIKPYFDKMDGKYKWCIAAIPTLDWAKKVFPNDSDEEAVEK